MIWRDDDDADKTYKITFIAQLSGRRQGNARVVGSIALWGLILFQYCNCAGDVVAQWLVRRTFMTSSINMRSWVQ